MNILINLTKDLKPLSREKFLLAVSGGLDSMALFSIFCHFREHFAFEFAVAHFHHGKSSKQEQLQFRNQAYSFVKETCRKEDVSFFSNVNEPVRLQKTEFNIEEPSEAEMRERRYHFFKSLKEKYSYSKLVLAHHQEDLFETRLIRMIRGVGPEGLEAMKFEDQLILRPLLKLSRVELKDFLIKKQIKWLEDPSNNDLGPLRNWLRQKWLKDLEEKNPGAVKNLSRSLDLILSSTRPQESLSQCFTGSQVIISELLSLNFPTQRQVIATYMKSQGLKNYGFSHVNEVLKRLDTEKKSHTFRLLGRSWTVDAGRMSVQKQE